MLPEVDACKMHPWHDGLSRGSRWVLVRSPATVGCASSPAPRVGVAGRPGKGEENPRMRQSDRYNPEQYFLTCLAIMGSVCQLEYVQREGFAEPSRSGMRVTPEPAGC